MTRLPWGEIRSLLARKPSQDVFAQIMRTISSLPKAPVQQELIPYLEAAFSAWPSCLELPRPIFLGDPHPVLANTLTISPTDDIRPWFASLELRNVQAVRLGGSRLSEASVRFVSRRSLKALCLGSATLTPGQDLQLAKMRAGVTHLTALPQATLANVAASAWFRSSVTHLHFIGDGPVSMFFDDGGSALQQVHFDRISRFNLSNAQGDRWDHLTSLSMPLWSLTSIKALPAALTDLTLLGTNLGPCMFIEFEEALLQVKRLTLIDSACILPNPIQPFYPQIEELTLESLSQDTLIRGVLALSAWTFPKLKRLTLRKGSATQAYLRPVDSSMEFWVKTIYREIEAQERKS